MSHAVQRVSVRKPYTKLLNRWLQLVLEPAHKLTNLAMACGC
ncbi:hypothetical protein CCACVL1_03114 [Corchorus capsularis]|uniref:Uncharacterized protein n=1 Tax=Corchorus capsularis TaxID=210143 RepID=A0A1R3K2M3_COCAP|nr:hypothetical protein CCACVL1_03114 [Corchorus capsularis]